MVLIPAGKFTVGEKGKQKEVYLDSFYIDLFEVTNEQYKRFVRATRSMSSYYATNTAFNGSDQPVVGVSWFDAQSYCTWAGLRLPTEAEWVKAARGSDNRRYPWGHKKEEANANHGYDESNHKGDSKDGYFFTSPVGSYPEGASPYGVMDMSGNVEEWVADGFARSFPDSLSRLHPQHPVPEEPSPTLRVVRGGSWQDGWKHLTLKHRRGSNPEQKSNAVGFRCVKEVVDSDRAGHQEEQHTP